LGGAIRGLLLPLAPEVRIGIMLMAAAPVAPLAPPFGREGVRNERT
jgi:hypothetical protein